MWSPRRDDSDEWDSSFSEQCRHAGLTSGSRQLRRPTTYENESEATRGSLKSLMKTLGGEFPSLHRGVTRYFRSFLPLFAREL
jgi:hypothetical protein